MRAEPYSDKAATRKKPGDDGLISLNLFTNNVIQACRKTISAERAKDIYFYQGQFSDVLWSAKWKEANDFEIFRTLALEHIEQAKQRNQFYENGEFSKRKWMECIGKCNHWYEAYDILIKNLQEKEQEKEEEEEEEEED